MRWTLTLALLLVAPGGALPAPCTGGTGWLVRPTTDAAAVWDGCGLLVYGGLVEGMPTASIEAWTPGTPLAHDLNESLPMPLAGTAAVWATNRTFLFGGEGPGGPTNGVWSHLPGHAVERVATLGSARSRAAAWFDARPEPGCLEGCIYLFGGHGPSGDLNEVLQFRPADWSLHAVATLPAPASGLLAVWTGTTLLLVAPHTLWTFDAPSRVTALGTPSVAPFAGLAFADGRAYLLGGDSGGPTGNVTLLDSMGRPSPSCQRLIPAVAHAAPAQSDGVAYLAGGLTAAGATAAIHVVPLLAPTACPGEATPTDPGACGLPSVQCADPEPAVPARPGEPILPRAAHLNVTHVWQGSLTLEEGPLTLHFASSQRCLTSGWIEVGPTAGEGAPFADVALASGCAATVTVRLMGSGPLEYYAGGWQSLEGSGGVGAGLRARTVYFAGHDGGTAWALLNGTGLFAVGPAGSPGTTLVWATTQAPREGTAWWWAASAAAAVAAALLTMGWRLFSRPGRR
ncbi:MAG: Kelch repeat-containing protein [Thermoplasmatota archaeon]